MAIFLLLFAAWIIARAAPATPNIMQGKKPDIYMPRLQVYVCGGVAGPEVAQVAQADGIKPEYVVQRVVQAGRDQQTVEERIDAGADCRPCPMMAFAQQLPER